MKNVYIFLILYIVSVFVVSLPTKQFMFDVLLNDIKGTCPELISTPLFDGSVPYFNVCDYFPKDDISMNNLQKYLCVNVIDADYQLCKKKSKKSDVPKNFSDLQEIINESKLTTEEFCRNITKYPETDYQMTKPFLSKINKDYNVFNKCLKICEDIDTKINPLCIIIHFINQKISVSTTETIQEKPAVIDTKTNEKNINLIVRQETPKVPNTTKTITPAKDIPKTSIKSEELKRNDTIPVTHQDAAKTLIEGSNTASNSKKIETPPQKPNPNPENHPSPPENPPNQLTNPANQVPNPPNQKSNPPNQESDPSNQQPKPPSRQLNPPNQEPKQPKEESIPQDQSVPQGPHESNPQDHETIPQGHETIPHESNQKTNPSKSNPESPKTTQQDSKKPDITIANSKSVEITTNPKIINEKDPDYPATGIEGDTDIDGNEPDDDDELEQKDNVNIPSKPLYSANSVLPNTKIEYQEIEESNFFTYFMFTSVVFIGCYIAYHNKQKILALVLEGRRDRNGRRRPNTAGYRKLNCTLEEAVTSKSGGLATHVIY